MSIRLDGGGLEDRESAGRGGAMGPAFVSSRASQRKSVAANGFFVGASSISRRRIGLGREISCLAGSIFDAMQSNAGGRGVRETHVVELADQLAGGLGSSPGIASHIRAHIRPQISSRSARR